MIGERRRRQQIRTPVRQRHADAMTTFGQCQQDALEMPEHRHQRHVEQDRHVSAPSFADV